MWISGETQRTGPVAAARAEHAWLRGDDQAVRDLAGPLYEEAGRLHDIVAETRETYDGPLVVGEDLMTFDIGEIVTMRKPQHVRP